VRIAAFYQLNLWFKFLVETIFEDASDDLAKIYHDRLYLDDKTTCDDYYKTFNEIYAIKERILSIFAFAIGPVWYVGLLKCLTEEAYKASFP
jgi:hypothetical protein